MAKEQDFDLGTAGASGRREYERRRDKREAEVRGRHPHIGNLMLKFQDAPESERAWATGAAGEEELGAYFAKRCPGVIVLNDRRMPRSKANIDHLAIVPTGIFVIDAKRYRGKIEVRKPIFGDEKLLIAGRNKAKLVDGLRRQAKAVQSAIESIGHEVPVNACFCFINPSAQASGSGVPLLRTLSVEGFPLYYPRKLVKRLNQPGELDPDRALLIAEALAVQFPAA